ncbi:hypothetical protein JHK84_039928 [Glycine max]|nr:hypothetical protein JHK84_039928 [Glycine max]
MEFSMFMKLSMVCETKFYYQDKIRPSDYVVNIASNKQFYPVKDWLTGSSLPSKFIPSVIQMVAWPKGQRPSVRGGDTFGVANDDAADIVANDDYVADIRDAHRTWDPGPTQD